MGSFFLDITTFSTLKVNQHFGGTCCLHLQGRRVSQAGNKQSLLPASIWFLVGVVSNPEDGGDMFV
jgi:hypothetical protein